MTVWLLTAGTLLGIGGWFLRWLRRHWWDATAARKSVVAARVVSALFLPVFLALIAGAGEAVFGWWLVAVFLAWVAAGVVALAERRASRRRDLLIGAHTGVSLWSIPAVVSVSFVGLILVWLAAAVVAALSQTLEAAHVIATLAAVAWAPIILGAVQYRRLVHARGGPSLTIDACQEIPARTGMAMAIGGVGWVLVSAWIGSVLAAGTFADPDDLSVSWTAGLFLCAPGWMLVAAGWVALHHARTPT